MNPSTKLLLDEMRKLFAEQNARLDRRFAEHNALIAPTPAPSAIATSVPTAPAPSAPASVATATAPSVAACISPAPATSVFTAPGPSAAASVTPRAPPRADGCKPQAAPAPAPPAGAFASTDPTAALTSAPSALHASSAAATRTPRAISLEPPRRATATRLHLVRPDVVPEALRWFIADPVVTLVGSDSAHDDHIQEEHVTVTPNLHSADTIVFEEQMVVPVEEDAVPSTLPNRCLMNCLSIIQSCFPLPFSYSWGAVICWQHGPWPPPSALRLVSCEAELRPLPWPSFNMVERVAVTSLSGRLWKPPWYVSTQQHISRVLPEPVESWTCLMRPGRIVVVPVLLGICLLDSEVTIASILSKLQLVHHGSCSDSGVSSMHILVHHSIAYQPPEMSEPMARVGTICSPCYVDVVDFGKFDDEQPEKLEALVVAVHSGGSSIPVAQYLVDQSIQSCFSPNWEYLMISTLGAVAMCDELGMRPIPWPPFWYSAVECGSRNSTSRLLVDYKLLKPRISWGDFLHFSAIAQSERHVLHSISSCCIFCGLVQPIRLLHLLSQWTSNFLFLLLSGCALIRERVQRKCGGNCQCFLLDVTGQKFRVAGGKAKDHWQANQKLLQQFLSSGPSCTEVSKILLCYFELLSLDPGEADSLRRLLSTTTVHLPTFCIIMKVRKIINLECPVFHIPVSYRMQPALICEMQLSLFRYEALLDYNLTSVLVLGTVLAPTCLFNGSSKACCWSEKPPWPPPGRHHIGWSSIVALLIGCVDREDQLLVFLQQKHVGWLTACTVQEFQWQSLLVDTFVMRLLYGTVALSQHQLVVVPDLLHNPFAFVPSTANITVKMRHQRCCHQFLQTAGSPSHQANCVANMLLDMEFLSLRSVFSVVKSLNIEITPWLTDQHGTACGYMMSTNWLVCNPSSEHFLHCKRPYTRCLSFTNTTSRIVPIWHMAGPIIHTGHTVLISGNISLLASSDIGWLELCKLIQFCHGLCNWPILFLDSYGNEGDLYYSVNTVVQPNNSEPVHLHYLEYGVLQRLLLVQLQFLEEDRHVDRSRIVSVINSTRHSLWLLELQFYHLMVEDP